MIYHNIHRSSISQRVGSPLSFFLSFSLPPSLYPGTLTILGPVRSNSSSVSSDPSRSKKKKKNPPTAALPRKSTMREHEIMPHPIVKLPLTLVREHRGFDRHCVRPARPRSSTIPFAALGSGPANERAKSHAGYSSKDCIHGFHSLAICKARLYNHSLHSKRTPSSCHHMSSSAALPGSLNWLCWYW